MANEVAKGSPAAKIIIGRANVRGVGSYSTVSTDGPITVAPSPYSPAASVDAL